MDYNHVITNFEMFATFGKVTKTAGLLVYLQWDALQTESLCPEFWVVIRYNQWGREIVIKPTVCCMDSLETRDTNIFSFTVWVHGNCISLFTYFSSNSTMIQT